MITFSKPNYKELLTQSLIIVGAWIFIFYSTWTAFSYSIDVAAVVLTFTIYFTFLNIVPTLFLMRDMITALRQIKSSNDIKRTNKKLFSIQIDTYVLKNHSHLLDSSETKLYLTKDFDIGIHRLNEKKLVLGNQENRQFKENIYKIIQRHLGTRKTKNLYKSNSILNITNAVLSTHTKMVGEKENSLIKLDGFV
jgi:hypothetical protein